VLGPDKQDNDMVPPASDAKLDRITRDPVMTPGIALFLAPVTALFLRIPAFYFLFRTSTTLYVVSGLACLCMASTLFITKPHTFAGKMVVWLLGIPSVLLAVGLLLYIVSPQNGHPDIGGVAFVLVAVLSFGLGSVAMAVLADAYASGESGAFTIIAMIQFYILAGAA
jgi:hypothetical protein